MGSAQAPKSLPRLRSYGWPTAWNAEPDKAIGKSLRDARTKAGLTQAELAAKLGKSQSLVARAESGDMVVGEKYMDAALKACRTATPKKPAPRRATAR